MFVRISGMVFLIVSTALVLGCGTGRTTRYSWCEYDVTLYEYYKEPAQREEFVKALKETIKEGEWSENSVPPGIYAEYGFLLYEQGEFPLAIRYFLKEYNKWPESRAFMSKMISNAQNHQSKKENLVVPAASAEPGNSQDMTNETGVGKQ